MSLEIKKAKPNMPWLSLVLYGRSGSGKTFTSLKLATGLAKLTGKHILLIDTDPLHPSGNYSIEVDPKFFDFDNVFPADIDELFSLVKNLDTAKYGVVIIDTFTWFWQALLDAKDLAGEAIAKVSSGPAKGMPQWTEYGKVKRVNSDLLFTLQNLPCHKIITAREKVQYDKANDNVPIGYEPKTEGDTPYDVQAFFRLFHGRERRDLGEANNPILQLAQCENDKTGAGLKGQTFRDMKFEDIVPLIKRLSGEQVPITTATDQALANAGVMDRDADNLKAFAEKSAGIRADFLTAIVNAADLDEIKKIGKEIGKNKKLLTETDWDSLKAEGEKRQAVLKEVK